MKTQHTQAAGSSEF